MSYSYDYLADFSGGINISSAPDSLLDNEMQVAQNIDPLLRGGFQMRSGIGLGINFSRANVKRLFDFEYYSSGSRLLKHLALTSAGELVDWNTYSGFTILNTGWVNHIDCEPYKNKLYILGSGELFKVYDGLNINDVTNTNPDSNLAAIKRCTFIEQRGERLFAAGDIQNPNALYYSEVGDPTYWKTTSIIQAITDDADVITGLKEYHGALLVFKKRTVYAWFGYNPATDVTFKQLNVDTGTQSPRTICNVGNYLLYLGEDGVYALKGTYENVINTQKISTNITPDIVRAMHTYYACDDSAAAIYDNGKYMIAFPLSDAYVNNTLYVLHTELSDFDAGNFCWTQYTGWQPHCFIKSYDGNLYFGSSTEGKIYQLYSSVYTDAGNYITVDVKTKPMFEGKPVHLKKYKRGWLWLKQYADSHSSATVKTFVDYIEVDGDMTADESLIWDDPAGVRSWDIAKWDFVDLVTTMFNIKKKGKRISFEIYSTALNQKLLVYGVGFEYKIKKPDRG
jgi:hypothetical protein